jgi:hypothetical protein
LEAHNLEPFPEHPLEAHNLEPFLEHPLEEHNLEPFLEHPLELFQEHNLEPFLEHPLELFQEHNLELPLVDDYLDPPMLTSQDMILKITTSQLMPMTNEKFSS